MSFNTPSARFVAYIPDGPASRRVTVFDIPIDAKVSALVNEIRTHWGHRKVLKGLDMYLLKCGELSISPEDSLPVRASEWLRKRTSQDRMLEDTRLDFYFPTGPAPEEEEIIDIFVSSPAVAEFNDSSEWAASKLCKDRRLLLEEMSSVLLPMDCAQWMACCRPPGNQAPSLDSHQSASAIRSLPTSLFNPVIAMLKYRLEHLDQLEDLEPESQLLEQCHRVIVHAPEAYGCFMDEGYEHQSTLKLLLDDLVNEYGHWQHHDHHGGGSAVWGSPAQILLAGRKVSGDATLQGILTYVRHLSHPAHLEYFDRSNCPVALLTVTDTRLEISSLVFIDGVYVEKLFSEELCLGPWQSDNVLRLGRIMVAVSLFFKESRISKQRHKSPITHLCPNPVPLKEGVRIPDLTYLAKLTHLGERTEMLQFEKSNPDCSVGSCARFVASMALQGCKVVESSQNKEVVVKFTSRYNKRAHRILAEKGLAPKLHFCEPVLGGLNMVVMDYIKGSPLWEVSCSTNRSAIFQDIKTAIELLHSENLVFGDLRVQNVIVKPEGRALLVDFDWAGVHEKDRYPATLNDDGQSTWAPGVGRRKIMKKEHDLFMLGEIESFLGVP